MQSLDITGDQSPVFVWLPLYKIGSFPPMLWGLFYVRFYIHLIFAPLQPDREPTATTQENRLGTLEKPYMRDPGAFLLYQFIYFLSLNSHYFTVKYCIFAFLDGKLREIFKT